MRRPSLLPTPLLLALLAASPSLARPEAPVLPKDGSTRTVRTWAPKGMTKNPVAICFDPAGNLYVAESDRAGNAVQDTRNLAHLHAVEDDLQFKSVEDRRAQIKRWVDSGAFPKDYFTRTEDRVRVLSDTKGAGVADKSTVFAAAFNNEVDGIGAGVLWHDGTLYYTCIPNLWALRDTNNDLQSDERTALFTGFGVRWCFYGHDLHGLTEGPDGRIYFSMGDRGFNVTTKEGKHLVGVDRGGVFRCWPDGSGLELFYQGLRNPQELAFNDFGDLFTGDNNCDSGDKARVVYVLEGGDSGWRQDVQSLDSRGPWNREFTWRTLAETPAGPARPAWTLPPLEYLGDGPSGLAFYPGTGENHTYDGCFFFVDFYGSGSTVHTFRCDPQGAGFKVTNPGKYFRGVTITDIAWGNDSRLYLSDWGGGWQPNDNGNILTVTNETVRNDPKEAAAIKDVAELLRAGFGARPETELVQLLHHRDQRVRRGAQFELAKRGPGSVPLLTELARTASEPLMARVHAIWAVAQIARGPRSLAAGLMPLLDDPDAEIRVQALRTLSDLRPDATLGLAAKATALLKDPSARVQLAAALALSKISEGESTSALLELLAANNNADLFVRHGAVLALARTARSEEMVRQAAQMNAAARLGALLALRIRGDEHCADFLDDADPGIAVEAARAIYDLRLIAGMPHLAALLEHPIPADRAIEPLLRRAIEANVLLGTDDCAARLAAFAATTSVDPDWRLLAVQRLQGWDAPLKREGVWGNWADYPARPVAALEAALRTHVESIVTAAAGKDKLLDAAYELQASHPVHLTRAQMEAHVADPSRPERYRLAVLNQLIKQTPEKTLDIVHTVLAPEADAHGALLRRADDLLAKADPEHAVEVLQHHAAVGEVRDRQHAVRVLGRIKTDAARSALTGMVADMELGTLDRAVALDVYDVALTLPEDAPARAYATQVGQQGSRPKGYSTRLLIAGGDPAAGHEIFLHHPSAECVRCHIVGGLGGKAGPDLSFVATRLSRREMLESIVEPNAVNALGTGRASAMPEMTQFLSPHEVRDVVAYLATLKPAEPEHAAAAPAVHPGSRALRYFGMGMMLLVGVLALRGWTRVE